MKKYLVSAAVMAVFGASSAFAQAPANFGSSLEFELNAVVDPICGARLNASSAGPELELDFGNLTQLPSTDQETRGGGSLTYVCNVASGFTRTISSQNGGFLTLDGAATTANNRRIPFTMEHGGGSGLGFAANDLSSPVVNSYATDAFRAGQTGGVTFRVNGVRVPVGTSTSLFTTTVFAGDYSDIVTVAITPNP